MIVNIVGAGLAGSEVAYQLGSRGVQVRLFEMRPVKMTEAHQTGAPAELVCSNSFKSLDRYHAHGAFKYELLTLGSFILQCALESRVPAGNSLAVDRSVLSQKVQDGLLSTKNIERFSAEVFSLDDLPTADATVVATGPLTSLGLSSYLQKISSSKNLFFYDAIAPIVASDSVDRSIAFSASRYEEVADNADYLNCPMDQTQYDAFINALLSSEQVPLHDFEEARYFQGCQPIEVIAQSGRDSLRFGPMKPVGLVDPRTGKRPYAVVQLRIDNISKSAYNLVGFQTKLKYGEQSRVFKMIPGLENAEFLRLGSMHRNTFLCAPTILDHALKIKDQPSESTPVYCAGQITGVEGYTESSATGLLVAMAILHQQRQNDLNSWVAPPRESFLGALVAYLQKTDPKDFQPMNVQFGLLPAFQEGVPMKGSKQERRKKLVNSGYDQLKTWALGLGWTLKNMNEFSSIFSGESSDL